MNPVVDALCVRLAAVKALRESEAAANAAEMKGLKNKRMLSRKEEISWWVTRLSLRLLFVLAVLQAHYAVGEGCCE
jgi:hypothetical protein